MEGKKKKTDGISLTWLFCDNVWVMCVRLNIKPDWLEDSNNNECSSSLSLSLSLLV